MSVRSSSGHVTELVAGCRSSDVDVTTDCSTSGGDSAVHTVSDQPRQRLSETSAADVATSQRPSLSVTTSCGDRRPSFMINDILAERSTASHRSPVDMPARPSPLVGAAGARFAHLDFSAMTHRPFPSSTAAAAAAAAAAACLQRRGLDDGVDIERCLQAAELRRLPAVSVAWTSPVDVVSVGQMTKRASSYSAECGSDIDVDLDDDNDVDSNSSLIG